MITASVTTKGQITIPKVIRNQLDLNAGDKLSFVEREDGTFTLVALKRPLKALKGLVARPVKPVSVADMNASVKRKAGRS